MPDYRAMILSEISREPPEPGPGPETIYLSPLGLIEKAPLDEPAFVVPIIEVPKAEAQPAPDNTPAYMRPGLPIQPGETLEDFCAREQRRVAESLDALKRVVCVDKDGELIRPCNANDMERYFTKRIMQMSGLISSTLYTIESCMAAIERMDNTGLEFNRERLEDLKKEIFELAYGS